MERFFLDANVLFSAAYLENSGLGRLWQLEDAELLSPAYAVEEARRNVALERPPGRVRLERLILKLSLINPPRNLKLPAEVRLDSKDRPILLAAIYGNADFLLIGDGRHFGHLYAKPARRYSAAAGAVFRTRAADVSGSPGLLLPCHGLFAHRISVALS